MKIFDTKKTTQELIGLGMALRGDRDTMETRIRGVFSRPKSTRAASLAAMVLVLALVFGCFTTACQPVVANASAEAFTAAAAAGTDVQTKSLLSFDGYAKGVLDGDRIVVTDGKGVEHTFTWVDESIRKTVDGAKELSEPIPEGTYVTPAEAALHAAETAVTVYGDAIPSCEIHINMYTGNGLELVYYGIGFNGTPFENIDLGYGYIDATTGTVLYLDMNYYGRISKQYGEDVINGKVRDSWDWHNEKYAEAHTSEKALATAMELIRTCYPTGEIVPADPAVWDAGSHTDGEQIEWAGGYVALVDAYIRMDKDPCYYVQVAVPLEDGAEPRITIFGCYPLGWDYCNNQIHDPAVLKQELADLEAMRNRVKVNAGSRERSYPVFDEKLLDERAEYAAKWVGLKFYLDGAGSYDKEFIEEQGRERAISMAFIDISLGTADPWSVAWLNLNTPEEVKRCALKGQTLEFPQTGLWAVYVGDGQCVYAKAEPDGGTGVITHASLEDMMQNGPCHLQINDYMVVSPEVEALLDPSEAQAPAAKTSAVTEKADRAEALQGTVFTPMADEWKPGDGAEEFSKIFLVRIDAYPDDGYESGELMTDPARVAALAQRGDVLRFAWGEQARYAVYLGDGVLVYADAEKDGTVRNAYVADWLNDTEGKPNCICSILNWR